MIRILLAEDQAMVRGALTALLSLETDIEVLGAAADGEAAWRELQRLKEVLVAQTGSRRSLATFPSLYPLLRLDHVMHSGALELLSLEVITAPPARRASDHLPIFARFNLNS